MTFTPPALVAMLPPTWLDPFEAKSTGHVSPCGAACCVHRLGHRARLHAHRGAERRRPGSMRAHARERHDELAVRRDRAAGEARCGRPTARPATRVRRAERGAGARPRPCCAGTRSRDGAGREHPRPVAPVLGELAGSRWRSRRGSRARGRANASGNIGGSVARVTAAVFTGRRAAATMKRGKLSGGRMTDGRSRGATGTVLLVDDDPTSLSAPSRASSRAASGASPPPTASPPPPAWRAHIARRWWCSTSCSATAAGSISSRSCARSRRPRASS